MTVFSYCQQSTELNYYFPCGNDTQNSTLLNMSTTNYKQCYFGRGPIQVILQNVFLSKRIFSFHTILTTDNLTIGSKRKISMLTY